MQMDERSPIIIGNIHYPQMVQHFSIMWCEYVFTFIQLATYSCTNVHVLVVQKCMICEFKIQAMMVNNDVESFVCLHTCTSVKVWI